MSDKKEAIVSRLREREWTLSELAEDIGEDKGRVHEILRGLRGNGLKRAVVDGKKLYSIAQEKPKTLRKEGKKLKALFSDKAFITFLIIILALGIFVRVNDISITGYWNDDITTLPTALLWFYPHDYYPGLSGQGEPALGNLIIGAGCMMSGEDFSGVTKITPMFYPGREEIIGPALINAFPWCHTPMYIFGIIFLLLISLFSIILLKDRCALYAIAFFAFYPVLLQYSRFIHVDVIEYAFVALGLMFLLLFYREPKGTKRELAYSVLAFAGFGLALATKLPAAVFCVFTLFIMLEKYRGEVFSVVKKLLETMNLNLADKIKVASGLKYDVLVKNLLLSLAAFAAVIFVGMELSFKNLYLVFMKYRESSISVGGFGFNKGLVDAVRNFLLSINILDLVLLLAGLYIAYCLLRKRKALEEKFILYLTVPFFLVLIFTYASNLERVFLVFALPFVFLAAWALSGKGHSLLSLVSKRWRSIVFFALLLIYVSYSFGLAYTSSPFFSEKNQFLCVFAEDCDTNLMPWGEMHVAKYLEYNLEEGETFLHDGWEMLYYYLHSDESIQKYYFRDAARKQLGRDPTYQEYVEYFKPSNRSIRYIVLPKTVSEDTLGSMEIYENYAPNAKVVVKGKEVALIYDVKDLRKKS